MVTRPEKKPRPTLLNFSEAFGISLSSNEEKSDPS
jgi:hypothetical protein